MATDVKSSSGYLIRLEKVEFKGKLYLDIRKYYLSKHRNEYYKTNKGVYIPVEDMVAVIDAAKKEGFC